MKRNTCSIPASTELAKPGKPLDGEAVDQSMQDQDEAVDGQDDVLGGQVAATVGPAGAEQDHHLDKLSQREIHARRTSPLR